MVEFELLTTSKPSITVQAENYSTAGGAYSGFTTYITASGVSTINFNQRGGWVGYQINTPEAGLYQLEAWLATTETNGAIEVFIDGLSKLKATEPNNGN